MSEKGGGGWWILKWGFYIALVLGAVGALGK